MLSMAVVLLMESATLDSVSARGPAATDSVSPTSAEQARLSSLLRERFVRVASRGTTAEVGGAWVVGDGLAFDGSRGASLPNPIPWSQVDTVWTRGSYTGTCALVGATFGGILFNVLSHPEDAGEFAGLVKFSSTVTGGLIGGAIGALAGAAIHSWQKVYPLDPKGVRGGWSLF